MSKYIVMALAVLAFAACKSRKQMSIEQLKLKEDSIEANFKEKKLNTDLLERTARLMDKFSRDYADDTMASYFLFRSGQLYAARQDNDEALRAYNDVRVRFPNSKYCGYAIFTIAGMYDDVLHNKDKAKEFYQMYISKYPGEKLAQDAKQLLINIDIPADSLIKIFERRNKLREDSIKHARGL